MSKTALEKQLKGKNIIESRIILRDAKIEN